jgi:hypothetical protein
MAQYTTKTLESVIRGTTFLGIGFLIKTGPDSLHLTPLPLTSAKMEVKVSENAPATLTLINGAGLTLDEASPGLVVIDNQIIDIDAFNYVYEIEVTTTTNEVFVYIKGTWEILN